MRHVILHGHIFKNAGTTFDWSLRKSFGSNFMDHRQDELMRKEGQTHLQSLVLNAPGLCAVSSHHMTADLPQIEGVNFIQVYLLRHPLARIRSVYDFERKQRASTPGAKAAKNKSFREYVDWRMRPDVARTIRNYQTLYLAGQHRYRAGADLVPGHLVAALHQVTDGAAVGVVERYDESMVLLEDALRSYFPAIDLSYVAQNVSKRGKSRRASEDVTADILGELGNLQRKVLDENSFDLALYQAAVVALQSRIDSIDAFPEKLEEFQLRCQGQARGFFRR